MAMGGLSQAVYTPYFVNTVNPASYNAFDTLSFVFDVSLHARFTTLQTDIISQSADYSSLGNLLFGFPINGWWKASFGLQPYSATGYKITDTQNDSVFGIFDNIYDGNGGISQFHLGSSFDITKNLSIGANIAYLFGTMNHHAATEFTDSLYRLNVKTVNSTRAHDFLINYGLMYHKQQTNGLQYNIGLTFTNQTDLSTTDDRLAYNYSTGSSGTEYPRDTIISESGAKGSITLPMSIGTGFSIGKDSKWMIGTDVTWKQWSKFSYLNAPDSLKDNIQIAVGGFYNPSLSTVSNYWQRVTYRGGFRYSDGFLELKNHRISEFGITFGVGLPLPRTFSTINLAVEVGARGTKKEGLISENFVKFTLGLSIFERWFIIKKYE